MSTGRKILNLATALVMIASSVILLAVPDIGGVIVVILLFAAFLIYGIRRLIYYFTMARHMVGGRSMLYMSIVIIDAAFFTFTVFNSASLVIMIYLIFLYAVSGVFEILRALEAKRMETPSWKRTMFFAVGNLVIAVLCGVFIRQEQIAVLIFSAGLIYSAVLKILDVFRKTDVLYITP